MIGFVSVSLNYKTALRGLSDVRKKQVPFAFAKALTDTAMASQRAIQVATPKLFRLHGDFIPKGVRVKPAKKSDILNFGLAQAEVYTAPAISKFMSLQEPGGIKKPPNRSLAIPGIALLDMNVKNAQGRIGPKYAPKNLVPQIARWKTHPRKRSHDGTHRNDQRAFRMIIGGSLRIMIHSTGTYWRQNIVELFGFKPLANIKPRWGFEGTVRKVAGDVFEPFFNRNLEAALNTAA